jgi:UDPglucose 6-dehydrogenase
MLRAVAKLHFEAFAGYLNTYLGMSIAYANEMARLCKVVGADSVVVTEALRSDARVSPKAPLLAGGPFNSGHLERDIYVLNELAKNHGVSVPIIENIMRSNNER